MSDIKNHRLIWQDLWKLIGFEDYKAYFWYESYISQNFWLKSYQKYAKI